MKQKQKRTMKELPLWERPYEKVLECGSASLSDAELLAVILRSGTRELSADGPIKPPYSVFFQGGLTWYHAKLGILKSLQKLSEAGLVTIP